MRLCLRPWISFGCAGATALFLAGCPSGSGTPELTPDGTGTVGGIHTFTVHSAIAFVPPDAGNGLNSSAVVLTDVVTNCADVASKQSIPFSSWTVETVMGSASDDTLQPGTVVLGDDAGTPLYPDGGIRFVIAIAGTKHDANLQDTAVGGTLVYTKASAEQIEGTLSAQMLGSDSVPYDLTATFSAPVCKTFNPF